MSEKVIVYFDNETNAQRFAVAAGSLMAGDGLTSADDLAKAMGRATRVQLDGPEVANEPQRMPPERAA